MTRELKEELIKLICDYENGDDQIEPLQTLESRVKRYLKKDKDFKRIYQEREKELENNPNY
jgi:hypothetical protein